MIPDIIMGGLAFAFVLSMVRLGFARRDLARAYTQIEDDADYIAELRENLEDLKRKLASMPRVSRRAGIIDKARRG